MDGGILLLDLPSIPQKPNPVVEHAPAHYAVAFSDDAFCYTDVANRVVHKVLDEDDVIVVGRGARTSPGVS